MQTQQSRSILSGIVVIFISSLTIAADPEPSPRENWEANAANLGAVKLTYVGLHHDLTSDRTETETIELGHGVFAHLLPAMWQEQVHVVAFDKELVVQRTRSTDEEQNIDYFDGENWLRYRSDRKLREKRRLDQLAGGLPYDPRWSFISYNQMLPETLLSEISFDLDNSNEAIFVPIQQRGNDSFNELRIRFDKQFGGLPISSTFSVVTEGGTKKRRLFESHFNYCRIVERESYVPTLIRHRFFQDGALRMVIEYNLVEIEIVERPVENFVTADLPAYGRLVDMTDRK